MSRVDAVVIGAGVNGLVAAGYLAGRGKKVVVLERRDVAGGVAAGEEFHEGYRTAGLLADTTGLRARVVDDLGLKKHGLKLHPARPDVLFAAREGKGVLMPADPGKAAAVLSAEDAAGYRTFRAQVEAAGSVLRDLLDEVPPDVDEPQLTQVMSLLRSAVRLRLLGATEMMELLRIFSMCVADWVAEHVADPRVQAGLAAPGVYGTWMGPWSPGSATNLLLHEIAAGPGVVGGPAALVATLVKAVEARGVEIRTGAAVEEIRVDGGKVAGVRLAGDETLDCRTVLASCAPRITFQELLDPLIVDARLDERITNFRCRGTTAKVNLALDGPLEFRDRAGERIAHARTGEHVDELEKAFDAAKYRTFAATPALEVHVPTVEDPSLAPDGKDVVSLLVHFAAHARDEPWDDAARDALGDAAVRTLEDFAPGTEARIVGREVLTPVDLATRHALPGGQIHHGEQAIDQWILRPTPETARYATPIGGLFLCGSGSHPGGGITGAPGMLAASVVP